MSTKLYTEEQVKESLLKYQNTSMFMSIDQIDYLISEITPIELPTDEEIVNKALEIQWSNTLFQEGAKWMRDKIGGSK